jgi:hypothetical protein
LDAGPGSPTLPVVPVCAAWDPTGGPRLLRSAPNSRTVDFESPWHAARLLRVLVLSFGARYTPRQLAIGLVASMTLLVSVFHPIGDDAEADVDARWGAPDATRPSTVPHELHARGGTHERGREPSEDSIDGEAGLEEEEDDELQREQEDRGVVVEAHSHAEVGSPTAKRIKVPRGRKEVIDVDAPIDFAAVMKGVVLPTGNGWPEVGVGAAAVLVGGRRRAGRKRSGWEAHC